MPKKKTRPTWGERQLNRVGLQSSRQMTEAIEFATAKVEANVKKRVAEAYVDGRDSGNDDPATSTFKAGGQGYKVTSGGVREPDISWPENLKAAWDLLQSNPLVDRASEIHRDYIIGRGIEPKAVDPPLQEILTDFWDDNGMSSYISELTKQWGDYGGQCVPCAVRESDGRVRLGYIDPDLIERVITDPGNSKEMWAVVVMEQRNQDPWVPETGKQVYRIVRKAEQVVVPEQRFAGRHKEACKWSVDTVGGDSVNVAHEPGLCPECGIELETQFAARVIEAHWHNPGDPKTNLDDPETAQDVSGKLTTAAQSPRQPWEEIMLDSYGLTEYSGDCFYIRKNADTNQTLGRSDHMQVADYADQHDAALYALGEREEIANFYLGLLRIIGDEPKVKEWQKKFNDWASNRQGGGVFVVNESVTDFTMNSPDLKQTSSVQTTDAQRRLVLGGEAIPSAWFSDPGGAHLASLTAQGDPTWRSLSHDQGIIQGWFVKMLMFVRDQAIIAGWYVPEPTVEKQIGSDGKEIEVAVDTDSSVSLPMPEMTVKDTGALATALMTIVGAAQMAEQSGYITKANGIDLVAKMAAELDVHPDVDELKEAAINGAQGAALGIGGEDAVENERSWHKVHAALEVEE